MVVGVVAACAITGVAVYFAHPDKGKGCNVTESVTPMANITTSPGDDNGTLFPSTTVPTTRAGVDDSPLLPSNMAPTHYDLRLRPDIYCEDPDDFIFNGTVTIDISVKQPSSEITLHQRNLNIHNSSVRVTKEDGQVSRPILIYNIITSTIHRCQKRLPVYQRDIYMQTNTTGAELCTNFTGDVVFNQID